MFELIHRSPLQLVSLVLAFVAVVYYVYLRRLRQKHALLPPGPPGSPHGKYQPRLIQKWIEEYGPVISLRQGNDVLVIIGRHQRMIPVVQGALLPGAYKVDQFPFLQYVPGYGRQLKQWGDEEYDMLMGYMNQYKSQMSSDSGPQSVAKDIVSRTVTEGHLTEPETAYFLGSLVGAAFDTTQVAISTIMMAAARFPEEQAVVHAQLDAVVGHDAPPTFADWASLTEMQAFILEALRWRPVNPFGAPRRASKDVIWNGYCIPAGATVFGNHWCIARDPEVFPDPEKFNPKRWMAPDGTINDLKAYSFGFGRRTCVGSNLAIRWVCLGVSNSVVWPRVVVASYIMLIDVLELLKRHECMTTGTQIDLDWYSQVSTEGSLVIRPG
ncbi:hypothetical protein HYDPIDRAFT_170175 [Hydnomerulius pinastri MD-312]|uniref:Cytochrome P450 n=1 Tax=Hydnomerulius pinastri MD-312 TaxID=994086 RepID=A0A0C9V4U3_9AGAM|nr:hypothetical protein HYDPIDRAFT_170175 [Hydnomerulius pinastri MD-312]